MPTKAVESRVRRQELDLSIDHRLGCAFPSERRELLWKIQERIERKRLWLAFRSLLSGIFSRPLVSGAQKLAEDLLREYAQVLTPEELEVYFNLRQGEQPSLPVEGNSFK